ncbi:hypothetical protein VspSTUT16_28500 [Vibrio sp. STUT-A16]|nr:hypothetical protein VspSTUT16_28500 [Vibrio sp. STUT-A16]
MYKKIEKINILIVTIKEYVIYTSDIFSLTSDVDFEYIKLLPNIIDNAVTNIAI